MIYLKKEFEIFKNIEKIKNNLSLRRDFTLFDGFNFFDKKKRGSITIFDIEKVFNYFDIFNDSADLEIFLQKYDRMNQGFIKYNNIFYFKNIRKYFL